MFISKKDAEKMQGEMNEAFSAHIDKQRKDRRRRVFEQVAIAYTTKHWPDYQEQPSDQTLMGWAEHTSEIILSSANKFAEKEIK